jgi:hypothetical protein
MPQAQSTTTRQLTASLDYLNKFTPAQFIAYREEQITELTTVIAAESEHLPNSIIWRDCWCYECEAQQTALSTARQLAIQCFDAGWIVENLRGHRLNCAECQEVL